jgi:cytochrome c553
MIRSNFPAQLAVLFFAALTPFAACADAKAGEKKAQLCLLCHKPNNQAAYVPTLEGQPRDYLYNQIKAYKEKRRPDPAMQTNVATLSDRDMRDIADYFSTQKPLRESFRLDAERIARGKSKAATLNCASCHMADFSGKNESPRLAGIVPQYLSSQLVAIAAGKRSHPVVDGLKDISAEVAEDLAHFFAQRE